MHGSARPRVRTITCKSYMYSERVCVPTTNYGLCCYFNLSPDCYLDTRSPADRSFPFGSFDVEGFCTWFDCWCRSVEKLHRNVHWQLRKLQQCVGVSWWHKVSYLCRESSGDYFKTPLRGTRTEQTQLKEWLQWFAEVTVKYFLVLNLDTNC